MIFILLLFLSIFHDKAYTKVYDCFLFFNELDLLDIRLHELYDHVDKFVLVESVETFRGGLKPLYYKENEKRFEKFSDKIIHIIVTERINTNNPWHIEAFQRNQMMRGLVNCEPDDTILVSDVDEIPRASTLPLIYQWLYLDKIDVLQCEQPVCRFYLNAKDYYYECPNWGGTCATTYQFLLNHTTPESLRHHRKGRYPMITQAGWHFSSMGGLTSFSQKLESFSHPEQDRPESKTQDYIINYMRSNCSFVPINETYPKYVVENLSAFIEKGLIYEPLVASEIWVRDAL